MEKSLLAWVFWVTNGSESLGVQGFRIWDPGFRIYRAFRVQGLETLMIRRGFRVFRVVGMFRVYRVE